MSDLMYSNWGRELQSIIENIDTKDVKEVMSQASKSYEELNSKRYTRNKEKYPMILNDIVKYELYLLDGCNNVDEENKPKKWEDHDLFVPTKTNFSANFKKFCLALGIDSENFKIGKFYAFKYDSKLVIHDILSNNSDYIHFLKNGVNKKDLESTNKINDNIYYFIKNEITNPIDYKTAMTNYYLYFLIDSNIEVGIKSKVIDIITAPNVSSAQKIDIINYYMDELDELKDEVNARLAATQSYSYSDYLEQECRVQIDVNLAKYLTKKETQASAPKSLVTRLLSQSELVDPPEYTKENRNKLISELKKALNYHLKNNNDKNNLDDSEYFYITSK
ncbi:MULTISPECIES: hypothetical protein [Staphylococcus]|uniref:Uncharacterized protein n=5 Tax=Staphylococcus TaxID=1279 RepID=F8WKI1_STAAU|nr:MULTISPECIES: hypothetical protein [Staphylococcus]MBE7355579.1 hypothetical protein [Staphylococcus haemolyticus]MCE5029788.1 hypothetical protein [Staphylococcus epidermidis]MBE7595812.1 hypothetical protein [Staphylococcus aureus]MBF8031079.1 hypothetical protein [Staphylococcus capitis]MBF8050836.1 hypothetical protein [Staphylococcus capitis]